MILIQCLCGFICTSIINGLAVSDELDTRIKRALELEVVEIKKLFEDKFAIQQKVIETLVVENESLKKSLVAIESDMIDLKKHLIQSETGNVRGEKEKDNKKTFTSVETDQNSRTVRQVSEHRVAFHAYQNNGDQCFHDGETITFPNVELNLENGYTKTDGIFDAPVTGVYVFTWTIVAAYREWVASQLVIDGAVKEIIASDSEHASDTHPATAVAIVRVNKSDHVFIRRNRGVGCNLTNDDRKRNSFSGWLLYDESEGIETIVG